MASSINTSNLVKVNKKGNYIQKGGGRHDYAIFYMESLTGFDLFNLGTQKSVILKLYLQNK